MKRWPPSTDYFMMRPSQDQVKTKGGGDGVRDLTGHYHLHEL